jgi:predicted nucleic-acid-binding protein
MKVAVDTNVLVRVIVKDNQQQTQAAAKILREAEIVAISLPCLCEVAWVLRRVYSFASQDIATAIETLLRPRNVVIDRPAVEAGLAVLRAGGDFADAVIAYEGEKMGGEQFISFDKKAVALLQKQDRKARLL